MVNRHMERRCTKCHRVKPATLEYFLKEPRNRSCGLTADCRLCRNLANAKRKARRRAIGHNVTPKWLVGTPEHIDYNRKKGRLYTRIYESKRNGQTKHIALYQQHLQMLRDNWFAWCNAQQEPLYMRVDNA